LTNIRSIKGGQGGAKKSPTVISVTSGKGGVGKTLTTVNMAVSFKRMGYSVLILDGDFGLANVDIVLGLQTRHNIRDVLDGNAELKDIVVDGPMGLKVIPSGSGVSSLTQLTHVQRQQLLDQVSKFDESFDILIIDTGAGIGDNVLQFNAHSDEIVVVTTPEPHAMTDAYALIKVMSENYENRSYNLIVNQTRSAEEGEKIYERINAVATRFLQVNVNYLGHVPLDPQVAKSVMQRKAASEQSTFTLAGQAWNKMARDLSDSSGVNPQNQNVQDFWRNLLWSEPTKESHLRL
jgi:flagellar biosynthesis protein FlhG